MGTSLNTAQFWVERHIAEAACGDVDACFELGMTYSCGGAEVAVDLVEAHKWFNISALHGDERGQRLRAEIAADMSMREIVEAQRQARAWLASHMRQAA